MKVILFMILNIIAFNEISTKNLNFTYIFKGSNLAKLSFQKPGIIAWKVGPPTLFPIKVSKVNNACNKKKIGILTNNFQKNLGLIQGSNFMASCIKGGLTTEEKIREAHKWALKNNYIRKDNYVKNISDFAKKISEKFKTIYHSDWKIVGANDKKHFLVKDSTGKEIFNSKCIG